MKLIQHKKLKYLVIGMSSILLLLSGCSTKEPVYISASVTVYNNGENPDNGMTLLSYQYDLNK